MEAYLPLLLDLSVILLLVVCVMKSAHVGFVRSVIELGGWLLSLAAAAVGSNAVAQGLFSGMLRPGLLRTVTGAIENLSNPDMILEELTQAVSALPTVVGNVLQVNVGDVSNRISAVIAGSADTVAVTLVDTLVGPAVILLMRMVLFFLIFALCMVAVKLVSQVFKLVDHVPLIGPANTFLGGCIGAVKGIFILGFAAVLIQSAIVMGGGAFLGMSQDTVDATNLLRLFFEYNPLLGQMGL